MITILERKEKESAKEYVIRVLIDNIVNMRLEPGRQLLEQNFCEQLKVSRTPFREAILDLSRRFLVDVKPKIGTYVSLIDVELVEEIRHLREILEAELASIACRQMTQEELDRLWENLAVWPIYIRKGQEEKVFQLNKEFYAMLYQMCRRSYWHEMLENFEPHFDRAQVLGFRCVPPGGVLGDHEKLLKAIENRNEEMARSIARSHMGLQAEGMERMRGVCPEYFV